MRKLIVAGIFGVLSMSCTGAPPPDASGPEIYAQICARCHGADLRGRIGPALDPGSHASMQPDSYLRSTVERGKGRMPSFGRTLSPDQIDRLIAYLREGQ